MNDLETIICAGIEAVRPGVVLPPLLNDREGPAGAWLLAGKRFLLCVGKAAVDCAKVVLDHTQCSGYFVLSPYPDPSGTLTVHPGSHPIPDINSYHSTVQLIRWLQSLSPGSELLVLLSGGSSALSVSPVASVSLQSKMQVNDLLIRSGATIQQINTVRKHLSGVKGGQLALMGKHLKTTVLVISDVIGDDLSVIGSGPFYPDPTTFLEARHVLETFHLWRQVPQDVRGAIQSGIDGLLPETPKPGSIDIPHFIIASNSLARNAAKQSAGFLGYSVLQTEETLQGDVETAAKNILHRMDAAPSRSAMVWGGEVTVQLKGAGVGGRNQHLALLMTRLLDRKRGAFAAAGTDGIDGNSPAAGAWTDSQTLHRASANALEEALENFDSFRFFHSIDQSILTGPTGTNVMDLYIAII